MKQSKPFSVSAIALSFFTVFSYAAVPSSVSVLPNLLINTTSPAYGATGRGQTGNSASTSFVSLQLNLCNSGYASCYASGDSIPEGGELIYTTGPNVVTINEICNDDVAVLQSYLGEAWPSDRTYSVFMPAINRSSNAAYKCKNENEYGSAVMGRLASSTATITAYGGKFTTQDTSNEQRIFACADASEHFVCTTHLSSSAESIALTQCNALMNDAIPYFTGGATQGKMVVGGDFNLEYDPDDVENMQKCVPSGWTRKGDGDVQHTMYTNDLVFSGSKKYGLSYTDHDGWLVKLTVG